MYRTLQQAWTTYTNIYGYVSIYIYICVYVKFYVYDAVQHVWMRGTGLPYCPPSY